PGAPCVEYDVVSHERAIRVVNRNPPFQSTLDHVATQVETCLTDKVQMRRVPTDVVADRVEWIVCRPAKIDYRCILDAPRDGHGQHHVSMHTGRHGAADHD